MTTSMRWRDDLDHATVVRELRELADYIERNPQGLFYAFAIDRPPVDCTEFGDEWRQYLGGTDRTISVTVRGP